MKNIILAILITLALASVWWIADQSSVTYTAPVEEVIIDNTPAWASDAEAVAAAEKVLHRKALEAELATLTAEIDERQVRVDEIEKELGTY